MVMCGTSSGPTTTLDLRYVFSRHLTLMGSMIGTRAELLHLTQLVGQGRLTPAIDTVFPLADARRAQERLIARDIFGKFVLVP